MAFLNIFSAFGCEARSAKREAQELDVPTVPTVPTMPTKKGNRSQYAGVKFER